MTISGSGGRPYGPAVLAAVLLAAAVAATAATAEDGTPSESANVAPRDLSRDEKARLEWLTGDAKRRPGKGPYLEDLMSRDRIIEEFALDEKAANPLHGRSVERTAAIPVPRTLPIDPGILRFRPLRRIRQLVHEDLYPYFDLYLYVNKAPKGVWAQRMFVFERLPDGEFRQLFHWLSSTGREKNERYYTTTPVGIFKLDPGRFHEITYSVQWGGVAMPFAMFLDFEYASRKSGIAIHGTSASTENHLGHRASGGCIRLAENDARMLFYLIRTNYAGMVPIFAYDRERGHTSKTGQLLRDENGDVVMEPGYRVLLIVDYVTN